MICKECNKQIIEDSGAKYVHVRLFEKVTAKLNNQPVDYTVDKGNIYIHYECWKEATPSYYHIKEEPIKPQPFSISGDGKRVIMNTSGAFTVDFKPQEATDKDLEEAFETIGKALEW